MAYNEYKVTVRDERGNKSRVVVHTRSDKEARQAAERVTGKRAESVKRER